MKYLITLPAGDHNSRGTGQQHHLPQLTRAVTSRSCIGVPISSL